MGSLIRRPNFTIEERLVYTERGKIFFVPSITEKNEKGVYRFRIALAHLSEENLIFSIADARFNEMDLDLALPVQVGGIMMCFQSGKVDPDLTKILFDKKGPIPFAGDEPAGEMPEDPEKRRDRAAWQTATFWMLAFTQRRVRGLSWEQAAEQGVPDPEQAWKDYLSWLIPGPRLEKGGVKPIEVKPEPGESSSELHTPPASCRRIKRRRRIFRRIRW